MPVGWWKIWSFEEAGYQNSVWISDVGQSFENQRGRVLLHVEIGVSSLIYL